MSLLGPFDAVRKGVKKVKFKVDESLTTSQEQGQNTNPVKETVKVVGSAVGSGAAVVGAGIVNGSHAANRALFNTNTKSKSSIGPDPVAGTCGGARNRPGEEPGFFEKTFLGKQGDQKVVCDGTTAAKLSLGVIKQAEGESGVAENVLNDYLNVRYNIVFSMIPEGKTIKIQEAIPRDDEEKQSDLMVELHRGQAVVLASTGGSLNNDSVILDVNARDEHEGRSNTTNVIKSAPYEPNFESVDVSDRNYYAIQELVVENFIAPSSSNPGVSSMLSAKMQLVEPGGFRFNDDVKVLGKQLGYGNVNIGRIMYRLDISFSGYDPSTGRWVQVIDMDTRKGKRIPFLTYYVIITKIEAKITNTGTVYELNLAPSGAAALRTEDFVTDAMSVFSGDANTFGGFLKNLENNLEQKRSEETTQNSTRPNGIVRKFEIIAPEPLKAAPFYAEAWAVQKAYLKEGASGALISGGKDIDILTVINAALTDLPYVHELFLAKTSENDNAQFVRPRTHFTTRFNVVYGAKDPEIADYRDMTIQIIIEPFLSFKKGSYSAKTVGIYTALESQARRVKQMESLGAIIRKYDYFNSSSNTEVLDFGINVSAFFTEAINSSMDFPGSKGVGVASSGSQQQKNLQKSSAQSYAEAIQTQIGTSLNGIADNDERFEVQRSDGTVIENSAANNSITPYGVLGGGKSISPDQNSYGSNTSEGSILAARKNRYMREFKDWLANDQQQIDNLNVRGDPLWLLSPYASADMNRLQQLSKMIRPQTDSIIFINIKAPNQRDYANPENYDGSMRKANPNVMGGFYGVTRVTSTFSGGSFTQTIQGYKLNHLNYVEESISFEDIIGASIKEKTASAAVSPGVPTIPPNAGKPAPVGVGEQKLPTSATALTQGANRLTGNILKGRGGGAF